jgi:hypothetical protein
VHEIAYRLRVELIVLEVPTCMLSTQDENKRPKDRRGGLSLQYCRPEYALGITNELPTSNFILMVISGDLIPPAFVCSHRLSRERWTV